MHSGHAARRRKAGDCSGFGTTWATRILRDPECLRQELLGRTLKRNSPTHTMARVRHCVECPKCLTRYLPGFSPYRNGSYLLPLTEGFADEWTLYCACGRPPISSRWSWSDLKLYAVSNQAHDRGYGPPEDIVPVVVGKPKVSTQTIS
jgi:hypothetical protein